jgi:hypothetical protein
MDGAEESSSEDRLGVEIKVANGADGFELD